MLYLEEIPRGYILRVDRFLDQDDFKELNFQFKKINIYYDKTFSAWKIAKSKAWESIQYITKMFGYSVDLKGIQLAKYSDEKQETKFLRNKTFNPEVLKVDLFNYQKEDILWALKRNRGFIASDPGVGKTIEAISIFSSLYQEKKIDSVLILVKNNLTFHWEREVLEFSSQFFEEDIIIVTNKNKRTLFENEDIQNKKIIICPNHLLGGVIDEYSSFSLKAHWNKENICLIVDESHEFKSTKAKRTQSLQSIIEEFEYRYMLSATPAINGFIGWYNQLRMLDKSIIPCSENVFKLDVARYIGDKFDPYAVKQYDSEKVKEYIERFKPWVIKRVKSELPEVKSKQFIKPIYFELSQKHLAVYTMVKNFYLEKIKEENGKITFNQIENKFPYLCLALDNPSLLKDKIQEEDKALFKPLETLLKNWSLEDNVKINYLDEFLKDKIKTQKEKVIVFDTHPMTLDEMFIHYKDYKPLIIHGRTGDSMESRQSKVDIFNDKYSDNKLFLLNIQTGGTGLNLQKACNTVVFLNLPWDTTLLRQGMDRTYRVTSENDSFVEILTYGKTIDDQRCTKSLRRIEFNDNVLKEDLDLEVII